MNEKFKLTFAIRQRFEDLSYEKRYTMHKLAYISGVPYSTLSSFLTGRCSTMTVYTLFNLCNGLEISLKDFFDDPMFD